MRAIPGNMGTSSRQEVHAHLPPWIGHPMLQWDHALSIPVILQLLSRLP